MARPREETAHRLDLIFDGVESLRNQIRKDTFDVASIIDVVGSDPKRILKWMQDENISSHIVDYCAGVSGSLTSHLRTADDHR